VDLPRLERARPEGLSQHRGRPDGRMDRATVGRRGAEAVRGGGALTAEARSPLLTIH